MGKKLCRAAVAAALLAALAASSAQAAVSALSIGTFALPIHLTWAPGDPNSVYVVERAGTVKIVRRAPSNPATFLNVSSRVSLAGEGGLLSIAFPPNHATTRRLYIAYANSDGDLEVDEFLRSASNFNAVDPASRRTILVIGHREFSNHYGGQLQFGPDGRLYLGTGDGGGGGDPLGNAQDLGDLRGKLLRIDPLPTPAAVSIHAYGLRNPWRFSFDRATGDLTIGDVGQATREEVDFAPRGTGVGANYGWNVWEGTFRFRPGDLVGHVEPVLERPRNAGACTSITGGYVVRDPSLPSLYGRYVYGDFCSGDLRAAKLMLPKATEDAAIRVNVPALVSFGEDSAGCVYAVSLSGPVYRLIEHPVRALTGGCALPGVRGV